MKLEHLWLACPLPAVRDVTTVYADRLPLGSPFPLKMLKHSISVEGRPAEPRSASSVPTLQCGHLQTKQWLLPVTHQSPGLAHGL